MSKLDEIRRKLKAQESNNASNRTSGELYRHWDAPDNTNTKLRFLPDANPDNVFFWVERMMLEFDYPGIKGHDENKSVTVRVPCMEMYPGGKCPVLTEIRPWWKNPDLEPLARKYWVKRSFTFQGFVQESAFDEQDPPENPIRTFSISGGIHKLIKSSLMDPDFETIPTDYINGTDFVIEKTKNGQFADYSTSKWARRETALTEEQLEAIETYGIKDLSTLLPAMPNDAEIAIIEQMFHDSVEGELYDPEKYAAHFKPYGFEWKADSAPATTNPVAAPKPAETPVTKTEKALDPTPTPTTKVDAEPAAATTGMTAQDILAQIRARKST